MYIPKHYREDDLTVLMTMIRQNSFATLVSTQEDGTLVANHLPFLLEQTSVPYGALKSHMALGNSQWRTFREDCEVLVIFQGAHAYISPSWYETELSVPTWNYVSVHAYGRPSLITEQTELHAHLTAMVNEYEGHFSQPWPFEKLPADYVEKMMKGIIGISIKLTHLEGKYKISQNRSYREKERIIEHLQTSADTTTCDMAKLMQERLRKD